MLDNFDWMETVACREGGRNGGLPDLYSEVSIQFKNEFSKTTMLEGVGNQSMSFTGVSPGHQ